MEEIVQNGAPVLREVAKIVPENLFGSPELARLIDNMSEALDNFPEGVALAAPQIGVSYRIFIVRADRTATPAPNHQPATSNPDIQVYINPEIVKTSRKRAPADEGCLSVNGMYGTINRHERVTVKARKYDGSHFQRGAGGLVAQIFEHEIDHLNGILFIDHANNLVHVQRKLSRQFAYFGTPKIAGDTLAILIKNDLIPSVVVTSPDAPKGRGLSVAPSETKTLALAHGIPVITPDKFDAGTIDNIGAFGCDYAVVVAYGKIFPEKLINIFPRGVLNIHYSLLPKYRGATPVESAMFVGENETGVTVQKMAEELDAGDILAQKSVEINPDETARELRPRLMEVGAKILLDAIPKYLSGTIAPIAQDASRATRTRKIKKEDGLICLDEPAEKNWNKYRAYADTIGVYFFDNGKRIKITKASFKNEKFIIERVIREGKNETAYNSSSVRNAAIS